jgi:urate oxidase
MTTTTITPVLKTTGSAFEDFIRDEYTTLIEVDERILSTAIDMDYRFAPFRISAPTDAKRLEFKLEQCIFGEYKGYKAG